MDCSNGVFSSINRLRWTVKIMLSLLSIFLEPYDSNQSAASLIFHENDADKALTDTSKFVLA